MVKQFNDADQIVKLKCDVHPWMTGYVLVSSHPFFAVTGDDGSFKITGCPPGQLHGRGLARALRRQDRRGHRRRRQARRGCVPVRSRSDAAIRGAPGGFSAINAPDVAPPPRRPPLCGRDRGRHVSADPDRRPGARHRLQPRVPRLADLLRLADAQDGGRRADRAQPPPGRGDRRHPDAGAGGDVDGDGIEGPGAAAACGRSGGWRSAWCSCRRCWAGSPSCCACRRRSRRRTRARRCCSS